MISFNLGIKSSLKIFFHRYLVIETRTINDDEDPPVICSPERQVRRPDIAGGPRDAQLLPFSHSGVKNAAASPSTSLLRRSFSSEPAAAASGVTALGSASIG